MVLLFRRWILCWISGGIKRWEGERGTQSICLFLKYGRSCGDTGGVGEGERCSCLKGYWWFHWGPPGPSLWPAGSSSAHWHSSPAHHDSPETTEHALTIYTVYTVYSASLQADSDSFQPHNSPERVSQLLADKNWRCGWWFRGLNPGYEPDIKMHASK